MLVMEGGVTTAERYVGGAEPAAELQAGTVILGRAPVLDAVDFSVTRGEFVALLGGNGSGKTTLVRALLGLVPLARGKVRLFGKPLTEFHDWHRIGYVPQRFTAAAGVPATVEEVVISGRMASARWLRPLSRADRDSVEQAMEATGISALRKKRVATLSGGQQQRVLIARALAGEPDFLLLDEPVASVDLDYQETFARTLATFSETGNTVLLVAHALGPMSGLVHRAVTLENGRVAYEGPPGGHLDEEHVHHPADERLLREADRPSGTP